MSNKAIIYARFSDSDHCESTKAQVKKCQDYCTEHGLDVVEVIAEAENKQTSGANADLPGYQRMLHLIQTGQTDHVVCGAMDRLHRAMSKFWVITSLMAQHNVLLHGVDNGGLYTPDLIGSFKQLFDAFGAESERKKIKDRMHGGLKRKIERGSLLFSQYRPFGYRVVIDEHKNHSLEIIESEARIVKQVFSWYISGLSMRQIAQRLTDLLIPTVADTLPNAPKRRPYGHWNPTAIRNMLRYDILIYVTTIVYTCQPGLSTTFYIPKFFDSSRPRYQNDQVRIKTPRIEKNRLCLQCWPGLFGML